MMKKYMLTRKQPKPCTHHATKHVFRPGNVPDGTTTMQVSFTPGKITEVDSEWSMSAAIEAGFVVEIRTSSKKRYNKPVVTTDEEKPVVETSDEPNDDADLRFDGGIKEDDESESESGEADYEELDDGTFQCLVCKRDGKKKILQTEKGMIDHIEANHR